LDPTQFPSHSLEKPPFFAIVKGMPKFNALFAYVWNHAVTKIVNMSTYVSPVTGESYEALLARKLPKADGTPSDTYAISKQFMALIHFYSACVLDASATNRRNMRHVFDDNLALYTTWEEKNIDWRSDLRDLLKHWAPVFEYLYKKKRVTSERDLEAYTRQQVNPLLL
jgi:hypothetical protein